MQDTSLTTTWRSPSNIAIIKYWGKHGEQFPDNPSLSITLSEAYTETRVSARALNHGEINSLTFLFEGKEHPAFANRIETYLQRLRALVPFLNQYQLRIETRNSFPHSSGIASSASAMSALALCIADVQSRIDGSTTSAEMFAQHVSMLARLGSGSACRSIYGPVSLWGKTPQVPDSTDEFAIPMSNVHRVFQNLRDTILILDDSVKVVSSGTGHALMKGHVFRNARIAQARQNLKMLLPVLHAGDIVTFGSIAEAEALALHALMMTSDPAYLLMQPNTLHILNRIIAFRTSSGLPVYYTLDAGPNVHILYPETEESKIRPWIQDQLSSFCKNGRMIHDRTGQGPVKIGEIGETGKTG